MKLTKTNSDKLTVELTMVIAPEDYAEASRKRLAECRRKADFKGFRKGNVPASLVKKVYGQQILADAINETIGKGLQQFIDDEKLHILGEPLSSANQPEVNWVDGEEFTFVFDLALTPEVNVEVSKDDEVPQYSVTVSAKEKSEMADNLKKYYEAQKVEKSDEQLEKEAAERFKENYKAEAEWTYHWNGEKPKFTFEVTGQRCKRVESGECEIFSKFKMELTTVYSNFTDKYEFYLMLPNDEEKQVNINEGAIEEEDLIPGIYKLIAREKE